MTFTYCALLYLLLVNILTFILYGIDKYKARHAHWRISEATLLWIAVAGGSLGALCGMYIWHHKTLHKKFQYLLPLILILQLAIATWITYRVYFCEF